MEPSLPSADPGTGVGPRLSVIMAVYNGAAYLAEAIESVLAQDMADFEFLIHDDGSTDGSWAILQDFAARDPRIRLSQDANAGLAASLNRLIANARAPFLARMDADDLCLPSRFARQLALLEAEPELDVLGSFCITMDEAGRPIARLGLPMDHDVIDANNLRGTVSISHPAVTMRRAAVLRAGGYDASFRSAQDVDLWLRMGEHGRLANMPEPGLKYRLHGGSISGSKLVEQATNVRRACDAAKARRGVEVPFDYKPWRMGEDRASKIDFYRRYAWQAWGNGFRDTWRHYALRALRLDPFAPESWKLLLTGWLKRPEAKVGRG